MTPSEKCLGKYREEPVPINWKCWDWHWLWMKFLLSWYCERSTDVRVIWRGKEDRRKEREKEMRANVWFLMKIVLGLLITPTHVGVHSMHQSEKNYHWNVLTTFIFLMHSCLAQCTRICLFCLDLVFFPLKTFIYFFRTWFALSLQCFEC